MELRRGGRTYQFIFFRQNNSWAMTREFCDVGSGFNPFNLKMLFSAWHCPFEKASLWSKNYKIFGWSSSNLQPPLIRSVRWVWQQCNGHDKFDVHLRLDHLRKDKQHLDQADPLWSQLQVRILNLNPFFLCSLILARRYIANLSQGSNWLRAILHGDLQPDLFVQLRSNARQHGLQQLHPHGGGSHFSPSDHFSEPPRKATVE